MLTKDVTGQERAALAALERAERRLKRLTKKIYLIAAIAAGSTALLGLGTLFGLFGEGLTLWHVALAIAATTMVTQYPLVHYIEKIENELSEQIAEISR